MNLEKEIYKILKDYFEVDLTYSKSVWVDNKDLQELAVRIAEAVKKQKLALIKEDIIEVLEKYNARYIKPVDVTEMINCDDNVSSSPFDINHDRIAFEILNKVGAEEKYKEKSAWFNDKDLGEIAFEIVNNIEEWKHLCEFATNRKNIEELKNYMEENKYRITEIIIKVSRPIF